MLHATHLCVHFKGSLHLHTCFCNSCCRCYPTAWCSGGVKILCACPHVWCYGIAWWNPVFFCKIQTLKICFILYECKKNIEGGIIGSTQTTLRVVCRNSACAFCQKTNDCCEMAISNILVSVVHQKTVWKSVTDFGSGVRKCHEPCIDFAACFSFSDSGSWHCFAKCIRQVLVAIAPVPLPLNGQWWLYTHFAQPPHCINRACECTSTQTKRSQHVLISFKVHISRLHDSSIPNYLAWNHLALNYLQTFILNVTQWWKVACLRLPCAMGQFFHPQDPKNIPELH